MGCCSAFKGFLITAALFVVEDQILKRNPAIQRMAFGPCLFTHLLYILCGLIFGRYIRVGRTARAGERGKAVTIAKRGQMKRFRRMRAGVDGKRVRPDSSSPNESSLEALAPRYQRCLLNLKDVLEAEKAGELDPTAPVTAVDIE